jgi:hypothetical protein
MATLGLGLFVIIRTKLVQVNFGFSRMSSSVKRDLNKMYAQTPASRLL